MALHDWFLLAFAVGTLWSVGSLVVGSLHLGHGPHAGHVGHSHAGHSHAGQGHSHSASSHISWLSSLVHPSSVAAFLTWFGGVGYLMTRHTGWRLWADLAVAGAAGLTGAWILGSFLRFLQSKEQPLDPADYQMAGVLGRVSATIRATGVGEVIYVRDGARKPVPARSEDGNAIERGEEVIVTRYERGIAYVRTWAAMVRPSPPPGWLGEALQKDKEDVE